MGVHSESKNRATVFECLSFGQHIPITYLINEFWYKQSPSLWSLVTSTCWFARCMKRKNQPKIFLA